MHSLSHKTIKVTLNFNVDKWSKFLSENRYDRETKALKLLSVDFSETYFIYPHHLVSLACLIEEYFLNGVEIKFIYNNKSGLAGQYIEKINFYDFWKPDFDRNNYISSSIDNTLRLWKIDKERLSGYAAYAKFFFETHFLKSKELLPLYLAIAESCNNIFDHSNSKAGGFILTQYYEGKKTLMVAICDFGVGIPKRINDYRLHNGEVKLSPCDAIEKALEKKYTTQSLPHNAGLGLDTIVSNVKITKGSLQIISKKAL